MDLKKYVSDINGIYKSSRSEWERLQDQLADITEKQLDVNKSAESKLRKAADVEELNNEKAGIKSELSDLQGSAEKELDEITEAFNDEIKTFFTAKPEDVDEAAAMLLNSDALSDDDLYAFAEKYSDNATMLKLIEKTAGSRQSDAGKALAAYIKSFMTTTEREDLLRSAVLTVYRSLNPVRGFADADANYWENEQFEKVQNEISETEKLDINKMPGYQK